jgi:serine/threonine-protein kinase
MPHKLPEPARPSRSAPAQEEHDAPPTKSESSVTPLPATSPPPAHNTPVDLEAIAAFKTLPSPASHADDPLIGQEPLGQYRIVKKLGEGGFGSAYLAEQLGVGRKAVIKILHPDLLRVEEVTKRFEREATILASLDHHHIVRLYNFGALEDGRLFLAMEYGGDITLETEIRRSGRLDADRALRIAEQVCEALQEAHEHGVVHRDLKPGNVLLSHKGTRDWAKVVDVGIARMVSAQDIGGTPRLTKTGAIVGTPAYFSPEQARGLTADGRSDLYSLGIALYEMLTGALPIHGVTPMDFIRAHCVDEPEPLTRHGLSVPAYIEEVLFKALEKDPDQRYQSAEEMHDALVRARALLHGAVAPPPAPAKWAPGKTARIAVGAAIAVLLVGGGVIAVLAARAPAVHVEVVRPLVPSSAATLVPAPVTPPPPKTFALFKKTPAVPVVRSEPPRPVQPPPAAAPVAPPVDGRAERLVFEARSLARGGDVNGAIEKYEQALELQSPPDVRLDALRGLSGGLDVAGHRYAALKSYLLLLPLVTGSEKDRVQARIKALRTELESGQ